MTEAETIRLASALQCRHLSKPRGVGTGQAFARSRDMPTCLPRGDALQGQRGLTRRTSTAEWNTVESLAVASEGRVPRRRSRATVSDVVGRIHLQVAIVRNRTMAASANWRGARKWTRRPQGREGGGGGTR